MSATFRPFNTHDLPACLALFDENCPEFFAPNERDDYQAFLNGDVQGYEVCRVGDRIVGAFGLLPGSTGRMALRWILLSPNVQGQGIGSTMMNHVVMSLRAKGGGILEIAASHKSAPFFARFGAREILTTPHGFGPDMHRVDMELLA